MATAERVLPPALLPGSQRPPRAHPHSTGPCLALRARTARPDLPRCFRGVRVSKAKAGTKWTAGPGRARGTGPAGCDGSNQSHRNSATSTESLQAPLGHGARPPAGPADGHRLQPALPARRTQERRLLRFKAFAVGHHRGVHRAAVREAERSGRAGEAGSQGLGGARAPATATQRPGHGLLLGHRAPHRRLRPASLRCLPGSPPPAAFSAFAGAPAPGRFRNSCLSAGPLLPQRGQHARLRRT